MHPFRVIVATTSEVKKKAFETSEVAKVLEGNYEFVECGADDEFAGERYPQPFTASGGIFAAMQRISAIKKKMGNDAVVIAIESYITENAKDCVCIYVSGEKQELIALSPAEYIASFPEKYLQYLASVEKYQPGVKGFKMTIGEVIENDANGTNVRLNWHKLFNPFDRVEQIRGTLNYVADLIQNIKRGCF